MQFFSAAWASGDLGDIEAATIVEKYDEHLSKLNQSGQVYLFATTVSLNDAYLDRLTFDAATGRVELLLLTGDLQVGYWRTTLSYGSARIAEGKPVLACGLASRTAEIWYDEFTNRIEGMSHTFLMAPHANAIRSPGEFRIDFQDFRFSQLQAGSRELATPEDRSVWG